MPSSGMHRAPRTANGASALRRRLDPYWKMEAGCALLFPVLAIYWWPPKSVAEAGALALSLLACCSLLVVGAYYWWAAVKRIDGDRGPIAKVVRLADRWERVLLGLSLLAMAVAVALVVARGVSSAALAALGFAFLACLEYLNYYHVQLQNFDHAADFRRLLRTRRLRRSHLAADLEALRRARRQPASPETIRN